MAGKNGGKRTGRPHGLTAERHKAIVESVEHGATQEQAALAAGISERTLYSWLERGRGIEEAIEQGASPPADRTDDARFLQFAQDLTRARATAVTVAVGALSAAMSSDWRAAAFFLERRNPELWGRRTAVDLSGKVSTEHVGVEEAVQELQDTIEALRKRAAKR